MAVTPSLPPRRRALKLIVGGAAGLALPALGVSARAQPGDAFPSRPVSLWVPWPAGGATDQV